MPKTVVAGGRPTRHIGHRVAQSGFRAFDYAAATGTPLNTYVVINLRETDKHGAATAFSLIRHKFRDWLNRHGKKSGHRLHPIYVYTFENPSGVPHVNWVLHVPPELKGEFDRKLPGWVAKVLGNVGPYDISCQSVRVGYHKRLAKYVMKGTDDRYVRHFHLQEVYEGSQGQVWGRRAGISQAIGPRARKRADFHPGRRRPYIPLHIAGQATEPKQPAELIENLALRNSQQVLRGDIFLP